MGVAAKSKTKSLKKKLRSQESNFADPACTDSCTSGNTKDYGVKSKRNVRQRQVAKEKPAATKQKRAYNKLKAENDISLQNAPLETCSLNKTEAANFDRPLSSSSQEYDSIPSQSEENLSRKEKAYKPRKSSKSTSRKRSAKTDNKRASSRSPRRSAADRKSRSSERKYSRNTRNSPERNNASEQNVDENEINRTVAKHQAQKQASTENLRRSQRSRSPINISATDKNVRSRPGSSKREYRKSKSGAKLKRESSDKASSRRNREQITQGYSEAHDIVQDISSDNIAFPGQRESLPDSNARTSKRSHRSQSPENDRSESKNADERVGSSKGRKKIRSKSPTVNSAISNRIPRSAQESKKSPRIRSTSEKSKKRREPSKRGKATIKTSSRKEGKKMRSKRDTNTRKVGRKSPKPR